MKNATRNYNEALQYHNKKIYSKAFSLFESAAQRGLPEAQVYVGMYYDYGYFVPQDKATAFSYYMMAAQQGNAWGQCTVGTCYLTGTGTAQDFDKAAAWLRRAAQKDNPTACYNLGTCYEAGKGVPVDKNTALEWYKRAADLGSQPGITHYNRLKQELDAPKNSPKPPVNPIEDAKRINQEAVELHKKKSYAASFPKFLQAAQMGLPIAMFNVGYAYQHGQGTAEDKEKAFYWISRSAEKDCNEGLCQLGYFYQYGIGTPINYQKAAEYYRKAAAKNYDVAINNMAYLYEHGLGVSKDTALAMEYYKRAADLGYSDAKSRYERLKQELSKSSNPLEEAKKINREGIELDKKKDHAAAFQKYLKAAQMGLPIAMHNVSACYHTGEGTAKDPEKAFYWASRGAAENEPYSIARLGWLHQDGIGTPKNLTEAVRLYEKAVAMGNGIGHNNLGVLYETGNGVLVDQERALALYEKAIALNNTVAPDNLARLKKKLNWPLPDPIPGSPEEARALFLQGVALDKEKRFQESFAIYLKSARMGNMDSMYNAAYSYHYGEGVPQNYHLAVYWYRKAAELGMKKAWNNLAHCYRHGNGVVKDSNRALALYKKAADLGDENGKKNYDKLYAELNGQTPPQNPKAPSSPPPQQPQQQPPEPVKPSAREELYSLIGLDGVKRDVQELISLMQYQQKRKEQGKKTSPVSMHMVFTGNPGTGKTTVARIIARLYYEMGILDKDTIVEVDRSKLVAKFVGHTADQTSKVIEQAKGGVLFIDEAYTLVKPNSENDFGQEAIDTLLKAMEDNRDNLVVIVAGYTAEMHRFISSNPGLKSRFKKFIEFEDYNGEQLKEIFLKMAIADEYAVDAAALEAAGKHFEVLYRTRDPKFGNGRVVRNFYQDVLAKVAARSMATSFTGQERITKADVEAVTGMVKKSSSKPAMEQLNELIGLDGVKQEVNGLVQLAKYRKLCMDAGMTAPSVSMHMVFTGNPGTGKTTVARLIAQIYHELGLLPTPNCIEVDRSALVGQHVGKTAPKTREVLERAMGGVLFIDEAYTLVKNESSNDFGQEAIDTILKVMEDNREGLVVIVAGYSEPMQKFIASNPGLQSRFTKQIHFEDYSAEELEQIFLRFARSYTLSPAARRELRDVCLQMEQSRTDSFGNGREVRSFFEDVVTRVAFRISSAPAANVNLKEILPEDLRQARKNWEKKHHPSPKKPPKIGFI